MKGCKVMKNIMFVVPKLTGGGAEKTVANLSKLLKDKYNIYIVIFRDTDTKYDYNGKLIILKNYKANHKFSNFTYAIKLSNELRKIKKNLCIDVAVSFLTYADIVNVLSKTSEKIYISIRNMDSLLLRKSLLFYITKFCCKKADQIIAISKHVNDDIQKNFKVKKDKIITIYNPCINNSIEKKELLNNNENFIITMGRLTDQKGHWHLIRAFNEVVKYYPDLKLYILGDGENKSLYQDLVDGYSLSNSVKFLGFVDNPLDYIIDAKLFIFTSLYEGLGNSLLETLSCKVPIISTDCDAGPREILAPETNHLKRIKDDIEFAKYGVLIPAFKNDKKNFKDPLVLEEKLLVKAIVTLLNNNDLRQKYIKNANKRLRDFSPKKISNQWSNILG